MRAVRILILVVIGTLFTVSVGSAQVHGSGFIGNTTQGGNGMILFDRHSHGSELWSGWSLGAFNPDGSGGGVLIQDPSNSLRGQWSPDGNKILYRTCIDCSATTSNPQQLVVTNADGSGRTVVYDPAAGETAEAAAWSRDGTQIVYSVGCMTTCSDLHVLRVMNADGSGKQDVNTTDVGLINAVQWSPSGFVYAGWCSNGEWGLYLVPTGGGACQLIADSNANGGPQGTDIDDNFDLSPDGTKVAYGLDYPTAAANIWVVNLATNVKSQLTDFPPPPPGGISGVYGGLAWSPDGSKIVFGYSDPFANTGNLEVLDISSAAMTGLLDPAGSAIEDFHPDWQPCVQGVTKSCVAPNYQAAQTITFDPLPDKTYGDPDFTVSATASSGLPVFYSASGSCTVGGSLVHLTGVGSCTITASQSGNTSWAPAPSVSQTFSIGKAGQPPPSSEAVVLVSGLGTKEPFTTFHSYCGGNTGTWDTLNRNLIAGGFKVFTAPIRFGDESAAPCVAPTDGAVPSLIDYIDSKGDIITNGERLAHFIEFLHQSYGVTSVQLVGHSYGGLWSRVALNYRAFFPDVQVTGITTVGTPHVGSFGADLAFALLDTPCPLDVTYLACTYAQHKLSDFADSTFGLPAMRGLTHQVLAAIGPSLSDSDGNGGCVPVSPIAGVAINSGYISQFPVPGVVQAATLAALGLAGPYVFPNDGIVGVESADARSAPLHNVQSPRYYPDVHSSQFAVTGAMEETSDPAILNLVQTILANPAPDVCHGLSQGLTHSFSSRGLRGSSRHPSIQRVHLQAVEAVGKGSATLHVGSSRDALLELPGTQVQCDGAPIITTPLGKGFRIAAVVPCPKPLRVLGDRRGVLLEEQTHEVAVLRFTKKLVRVSMSGGSASAIRVDVLSGRHWKRLRRSHGRFSLNGRRGVVTVRVTATLSHGVRASGSTTIRL